ncbi:MAG TPA: sulfocyanin-like copper-binding protein [Acidimicrobiales bacterium]|nr:sulfocyanin-like copper-binding protein [Acidimicrobiales bacterium]
MARTRLVALGAALALVIAVTACSSSSKTSTSNTSAAGGGLTTSSAAGGTTVQVVVKDTNGLNGMMSMTVTPSTVPAGNVTFVVKNEGTIDHEAVVLKLDPGQVWDKLPTDYAGDPPAKVASGGDKVSEANNIGETGDPNLKPGESRTFTIKNMTAGNYAVVCNIAKHYAMGMRAPLTVS